MDTILAHFFELIAGLPAGLQFLTASAIDVVPHLGSHVGAFLGALTGIPVALAALAAIAGNLLALADAILAGGVWGVVLVGLGLGAMTALT